MENFNEIDFTLQWVRLKRARYQSTIFCGLEKRFNAKKEMKCPTDPHGHCRNFD